ncbi:MAG TPA: RDD family protein [Chitinophagaceae bacterium]|nr:RDD family protein [Chitinophagaceae bacterium]
MEEQQDLLLEVEEEAYLEKVSAGTRFANYIIDIIGFYIFYFILTILIGLIVVGLSDPGNRYENAGFLRDRLTLYAISITSFVLYYALLEGLTKGRTLGKLVTGSKVVMDDGTKITWKAAIGRTFSRLVPFEPFSAFGGYPWHDQWTNTQVVKIRK